MRDSVILGGLNQIEYKVAKDMGALHDMNVLCRTRIDAVESVLFGLPGGIFRALILSIVWPSKLKDLIDDAHARALDDYNKRTQAMAEETLKKSQKLTVMGAL